MEDKSLKSKLVSGAVSVFLLKLLFLLLSTITSLILVKILSLEEFGLFSYALAWINVVSIPATIGLDKFLVFQLSIFSTKEEWSNAKGLINWSNKIVLLIASALTSILISIATLYPSNLSITSKISLCIIFISLPLIALRSIRLAILKGFNHIVLGLLPEMLIAPLLLLVLIGLFHYLRDNNFGIIDISIIYLITTLITFNLGVIWLRKALPIELKNTTEKICSKEWLYQTIPLTLLGATQIIYSKIDILMLGTLSSVSDVGIYTVVSRGTQLIAFSLGVVNSILAPNIASLYATGDIKKMQRLLHKSASLSFIVSLSIGLITIIFRDFILGLFGQRFLIGSQALIILSIGYLVNAATGSNGQVINMTGKSYFMVVTVGIGGLANGIFNFLLIPKLGISGAAIATSITISVVNCINAYYVNRQFGLNTTVINF